MTKKIFSVGTLSLFTMLLPLLATAEIIDIPEEATDYQEIQFDWRHKHWLINDFNESEYGVIRRVLSPFYSNDVEKFPFSVQAGNSGIPDFLPEDGWEMLYHNLGFDQNGVEKKYKDYSYPYVALYSRPRGMVRLIAYINHLPYTYNHVEIGLSNSTEVNELSPKSLNLFSSFKPIGNFDVNNYASEATTISTLYVHDNRQFIYGDIPISYDSCVKFTNNSMRVRIAPVSKAELILSGRFMSTSSDVIKEGEYLEKDFLSSYLKDGNKIDNDSVGVLTYSNYKRLFNESDSERFAEAIYSTGGNEELDKLMKVMNFGIDKLSGSAAMTGVPMTPQVLSAASKGLNFFDFAPTTTLDGFKMPDPPSFMSVGEMALKGESKVEASVRAMEFPLRGNAQSSEEPIGLFNLRQVPSVQVIPLLNIGNSKYDYLHIDKDGYTIKAAYFHLNKGPRLSFSHSELSGVLSKYAKKNGVKVYFGLEARAENTSRVDGHLIYPDKPEAICGFYQCAEDYGDEVESYVSDPILFDQWNESLGRYTMNFSIPYKDGVDGESYRRNRYKNFSLYLKIWVVPEHLMEDYSDDRSNLDREAAMQPIQHFTYPIKAIAYPTVQGSLDLTGKQGGFEITKSNLHNGSRIRNDYKEYDEETGIMSNLASGAGEYMCSYKK